MNDPTRDEIDRLREENRTLAREVAGLRRFIRSLQNLADASEGDVSSHIVELLEQILRNALEATVFPALDARANQAVRAAAAQAFGLTAVSPTASIDALLFSVRGVRLVRQVARAYGLRPHGLATWELLRRTMSSASLVAAADIAGGMLSHAILTNPFAAKIAGEVAGATVASQRMYRLGRVASAACRLFPRRSGKED